MPHVVPVEQHAVYAPLVKLPVDFIRHGALAAARQAREPHHAASMAVQLLAFRARNAVGMPNNLRNGWIRQFCTFCRVGCSPPYRFSSRGLKPHYEI